MADAQPLGYAVASPTKAFFVTMLTRDIELQDAILDLLDNCVDGILRTASSEQLSSERPYEGFTATLILNSSHFQIVDNCGGIPLTTAQKYAFAMGKPEGAEGQGSSATVGMYGIGMKRAIFKLGTDALVESFNDTPFAVEFTPEWMADDSWEALPIKELDPAKLHERGTSITVMQLHDDVRLFFENAAWVDDFRKTVSRHFSIIIAKGFSVLVGTEETAVVPVTAESFFLMKTQTDERGEQIAPYIYSGKLDGVSVEIYAGLYRELLRSEDAEEEEDSRGSADNAGWTVACNDRVVIWKDKTRLTGWGEATVPNYHGQFIAITGIVLLRSDDPTLLPLTTTKRGIDASSNIYSEVKDLMRESTKNLTSFTNRWKKFPEKLEELYKATEYVDLPKLRALSASVPMSAVRKLPTISRHLPAYPAPAQEKTHSVVKFEAEVRLIRGLGEIYFGKGEPFRPADVGREAFRREAKARLE